MAQYGYTPISLYYSSVPSAVPSVGNLVYGELAINIADGKLYYLDNLGSVQYFSATALSGYVPITGGTMTGPLILSGAPTTGLQAATKAYVDAAVAGGGGGGGVTAVTGTAPVVSSGGTTPAISMPAATASVNGYMTSVYASKLDGIAAGATNVTLTSQLTNDSGFVTSAGTVANAGYATTAGTANAVAWTNVSGRPTVVSAFTNDAGYITAATIPANGAVGNYALSYFGVTPALGSTVAGSVLGSLNACCVFVAYGYSGTWRVEGSTTQTSVLLVRIA